MVKLRLLSIFSLLLAIGAFGQAQTDSIQYKRPIAPSFYVDYGKLLTIATDFETKYEGGLELLIKEKFPIIVEVGHATLTPEGAYSNGTYQSEGFFYRIGGGFYNQFQLKNKVGITFRYATAAFSEDGRIFIESPSGIQGNFVQNIERKNLSATWYEAVFYSDQKLSDLFTIGLNLRLRVLGSYDEQPGVDVYAIPGYGRSFDQTVPAANFFLKVTF